jgi:hypothetical protein
MIVILAALNAIRRQTERAGGLSELKPRLKHDESE